LSIWAEVSNWSSARHHGAQVEPVQEGQIDVSLEMEKEAHAPTAEETPQDAATLQVKNDFSESSPIERVSKLSTSQGLRLTY